MSSSKPKPLISLITLENERFEGTLHHLDNDSNTVTLTDVRNFGTEDRKSKKGFMRADSVVHEKICFEGKNLREVNVIQVPTKVPKQEKIVAQRPQSSDIAAKPKGPEVKKYSSLFDDPNKKKPSVAETKPKAVPEKIKQRESKERPHGQTTRTQFQVAQRDKVKSKPADFAPENSSHMPHIPQKDFKKREFHHKKVQGDCPYKQQLERAPKSEPSPDSADFTEEFDFAAHNEKFERMNVEFESLKVYDKSSSFFDNLSSRPEKKDFSLAGRVKAQEERRNAKKVDVETFGSEMASSYRQPRYHRNRYQKKKQTEKFH